MNYMHTLCCWVSALPIYDHLALYTCPAEIVRTAGTQRSTPTMCKTMSHCLSYLGAQAIFTCLVCRARSCRSCCQGEVGQDLNSSSHVLLPKHSLIDICQVSKNVGTSCRDCVDCQNPKVDTHEVQGNVPLSVLPRCSSNLHPPYV
jgi:hypothetical protein